MQETTEADDRCSDRVRGIKIGRSRFTKGAVAIFVLIVHHLSFLICH